MKDNTNASSVKSVSLLHKSGSDEYISDQVLLAVLIVDLLAHRAAESGLWWRTQISGRSRQGYKEVRQFVIAKYSTK